jgi:hypothetical protein
MAQATLRQIPALIAARKPFKGNSMWADGFEKGFAFGSTGRLSTDEADRFWADHKAIVYIVYSYGTPIAWVLDDGTTYKVAQKFSVTTSRHQGTLSAL